MTGDVVFILSMVTIHFKLQMGTNKKVSLQKRERLFTYLTIC